MKDLLQKIKPILIGLGLSAIASIITIGLHSYNIFDTLEYKLYDFKFQLRGPTSGDLSLNPILKKAEEYTDLNSNNNYDFGEPYIDIGNDKWDKGESFVDINDNGNYDLGEEFTDSGNGFYDNGMKVILVEIDDESYRLIDESYPFPRERVWARAIKNLALAGAKVIFFDIIFDKPDHQSETIIKELGSEIDGFTHGDTALKEAIKFANTQGTTIILGGKIAIEPTRVPPHYYLKPTPVVMESEPLTAIVGVPTDIDGLHRRYMIFQEIPNDSTWYLTAGVKSALAYLDIEYNQESFEYSREKKHLIITDNDRALTIKTYGNENTFLINYYGPASGAKAPIGENRTFKTFNRYPLANIIDNAEYDLSPVMEDTDWMDQFLPGVIPDYILAIDDLDQRQMMMDLLGIGKSDLSNSPFNNKIVVIGTSLPEDQDLKVTPYYSLWGKEYLMPGMEVHANAIQQILDNNYISVINNSIFHDSNNRGIDILIISVLSLLTFLVFYFANPVISAIFVVVEITLWIFYSIGGFVNNYLWVLKYFSEEFYIIPPSFDESIVIPVIFPLASIILTYGINLSYKLVTEGQDKAFLKAAFGNYISPELIDDMFDSKQKPQLGGDNGMRTAYFTDIASFSTFSEKLTASRLVELLNEYLTVMTDILLEEGGTLDKYEGDAIIAFLEHLLNNLIIHLGDYVQQLECKKVVKNFGKNGLMKVIIGLK